MPQGKGCLEDSASPKSAVWESLQKAEGTCGKFLSVKIWKKKKKILKPGSFPIGIPEGILQKAASDARETQI